MSFENLQSKISHQIRKLVLALRAAFGTVVGAILAMVGLSLLLTLGIAAAGISALMLITPLALDSVRGQQAHENA